MAAPLAVRPGLPRGPQLRGGLIGVIRGKGRLCPGVCGPSAPHTKATAGAMVGREMMGNARRNQGGPASPMGC